ncbi:uncharacterized protein LOC121734489 [Aricia agestis]|uniref:uncharacterized protein LOC121734489 n=1 Tax=Aricia agestis TaxID=91739 RepID=UPI001C2086AF|nr:uncharacterized protein LOC121734489 [Aricia agestis]
MTRTRSKVNAEQPQDIYSDEELETATPAQKMAAAPAPLFSHGNRDDASSIPHSSVPPPHQHEHQEFQHNDAEGDDATRIPHRPSAPHIADATFSQQSVSMLLEGLQRTQTNAIKEILDSVLGHRAMTSTPAPVPTESGNFARCKAVFSGAPTESIEGFIDAVESYKECANVTDSNAIKGMSMLLTQDAATWWQGIKNQVTTWDEVVINLRSAYGDRRPPHRIYRDLFATEQQIENTDVFVAKARALLSRLPQNDLTEKVKLDMIYGLLNVRIRKRLRREEFTTFAELLQHARNIEDSMGEEERRASTARPSPAGASTFRTAPAPSAAGAQTRGVPAVRAQPAASAALPLPPPPRAAAALHAPAQPQPQQRGVPDVNAPFRASPTTSASASGPARPYCTYCKRYGHRREQCRKLENRGESFRDTNNASENAVNKFYSVNDKYTSYIENVPTPCKGTVPKCKKSGTDFVQNSYKFRSHKINDVIISHMCPEGKCSNSDLSHNVPCTCCNGVMLKCNKSDLACKCSTFFVDNFNDATMTCPQVKCDKSDFSQIHVDTDNNVFSQNNAKGKRTCNGRLQKCNKSDFSQNHVDTDNNVFSQNNAKGACTCNGTLQKCNKSDFLQNFVDTDNNVFSQNNAKGKRTCNGTLQRCNKSDFSEKSTQYVKNFNFTDDVNLLYCYDDNYVRIKDDDDLLACSVGDSPVKRRDLRPIFKIEILGVNGTALIDTAAKHCIAGHTLYALLLRKGHPLTPSTRQIKLADGHAREMNVLTTTLQVRLEHVIITIPFLIFPESGDNETLLGIDFLRAMGVVINLSKEIWYFDKNPRVKHTLLFEPTSRGTTCASTDVLRDDEGTQLESAEREELAQILVRHAHIFRPGGAPTPFAEHRIDTGEHPPIAVPPYRLNPAKKEVMKKEIEKMLQEDIIEECESAWCAPALMIPKARGGVRFCVDYRRLNAVTRSDTYPMPLIDELLQSTKRNCFMSTLDLKSGYWQVSVREEDRDKTAFISPLGIYRFKRMPFGLKNAPATFQRLIDRLRSCSSLKDVVLLAYLDDLLIISEGFQQHLKDLEAVFERLTEYNLCVNREKCVFAREKVKYLGHIITQEGVSIDNDKVSSVLEMKEPTNLKHMRTFLQTCSWFRKFIPNFSQVAEPLTRLTRKNQAWTWGAAQSQAFNELKRLLTSAPILIQADFSRPFILRTDASNYALGAVLLQGEEKEERPIEYASRLLTSAEQNYSTTEREALAVVWAVERFRSYLDGQPVIIGSDHQPLRWLLTLKSPTGRLVRWALKLQSFDIQYQYTPGKANVVADTLSRPICSGETRDQCGICSVIIDVPVKKPDLLRQEQLADPELEKIVKELEANDEVAAQRWTERGYMMDQGVLYRYNPDSDSESPQLVVPADQQEDILKQCHDSAVAGHPGIDNTYRKVSQLYYFTGMRRIITDYVKACVQCQRYKASNNKPPGLLQTPVMNQRNEVLAIDLFGPLPEGEEGERWILLVEDTATRWVELYAIKDATAEACARVLIEEFFMRYGLPRRIISDNGVQFISAVMRQCMSVLGVTQNLVPLYHPEANPAERKNRDLKAQLARLVEGDHRTWPKNLPVIRFALNSAVCRTTGTTPAYLTFGRELRSPSEATHDQRAILDKDNFVPQITPYLRRFLNSLSAIRERVEKQQDKAKEYADQSRRQVDFQVGDKVLLKSHLLSKGSKALTAKFMPRRDGPYVIAKKISPTTYNIARMELPHEIIGKYHVQDLTRFIGNDDTPPEPVNPVKKRGRPKKVDEQLVQERGRTPELEGEYIANHVNTNNRVLPKRASRRRMPARYAASVSVVPG